MSPKNLAGKILEPCTFAILVIFSLAPTAPADWQIETVAAVPPSGTPPALAFDGQDRPHIAYAAPEVDLSLPILHTYRTAAWTEPAPTGLYAARTPLLAGAMHMSSAADGMYLSTLRAGPIAPRGSAAVFRDGRWQEIRELSSDSKGIPGAAVDATGRPVFVWYGNEFGGTAEKDWSVVTSLEPLTTTMLSPSLGTGYPVLFEPEGALALDGDAAFDRSGRLHTVQYYAISQSGALFYAAGPPEGPFSVQDVDLGWWAKAGRPSIAVDRQDRPHIAYTVLWPYYGVKYVTLTENGWQGQLVDLGGTPEAFVGTMPEILIDPADIIHILYADGLHGLLKHAWLDQDEWLIETVDVIGTQADFGPLVGALDAAMDSTGGIGVAYWDADDQA